MNGKKILYIEDNPQNMRLIKRLLGIEGYEVIGAADGLKGISMALREKPDLILMDIHLPGIDGIETTSRIKSMNELSHIPIIALTAAAMRGDKERIVGSGCDDYLAKPVNKDELMKKLQEYMPTTFAVTV